jgi:hypothetical protein
MKKCSKCLEVKKLSEFSKDSRAKDGLQYKCKSCVKQYQVENADKIKQYDKQYRQENAEKLRHYQKQYYEQNPDKIKQRLESLKDGLHRVYILPDHHYAGTTECIITRMYKHRSLYGRNTDNYLIVGVYENRDDAKAHESRLHDMGYNGRHRYNAYK